MRKWYAYVCYPAFRAITQHTIYATDWPAARAVLAHLIGTDGPVRSARFFIDETELPMTYWESGDPGTWARVEL